MPASRRPVRSLVAASIAAALVLAACGGEDDAEAGGPVSCEPGEVPVKQEGALTIGTDSPAYDPWFSNDDPTNGEGFESAVAYAVAAELGFTNEQVRWVTVPFNSSFAPGEKAFDFNINQVSITEERKAAVDFSDGYYSVNQALVGFADSPVAAATSVADLKDFTFGAQVGTTSLDFITEVIAPDSDPFVYNDNNAAKAALEAGQVDAIVLDLPTAFYVSAVEIEGTKVIGQFPSVGDSPEQFGMVVEKGNPFLTCLNGAIAALVASGELAAIEQQWLSDVVEAPVIAVG
jgi:polar amino acid transport system substrate-binding protein